MAGDSPTTPGRPQPPPPPPPPPGPPQQKPPGPPPPATPPTLPPAYGAPPPPPRGRGGPLWLWILIGVIALVVVGVVAYMLLSGNDWEREEGREGREGRDGPSPGTQTDQATVSVQTGLCDAAAGTTPIDVAIDPADAASVTVTGGDGFEQTFSGTGGSSPVGPGEYSWTAVPAEGVTIEGQPTGTLAIASCQEVQGDFSIQETELLAHIPGPIRASCQMIPPEQALGRAAASLLCEHQDTTLFYDLFPNASQMETYYGSRVNEFEVVRGSRSCDSAQRAENAYIRSRDNQEFEVGRLLCFRDAGNAVFIWTDRRVDISVEAHREDRTNQQLFRLWARVEFGPLA
jgi:hypothetical protein